MFYAHFSNLAVCFNAPLKTPNSLWGTRDDIVSLFAKHV